MKQKIDKKYVLVDFVRHKEDTFSKTSYLSYEDFEQTKVLEKLFEETKWLQYKDIVKNFKSSHSERGNLTRILSFTKYRGGEKGNVPYDFISLLQMMFVIKLIKELKFPQPEVVPWRGGKGLQTEWSFPIRPEYGEYFYIEAAIGPDYDYSLYIMDPYYEVDIEVKEAHMLHRILKQIILFLLE